MHYVEFWNESGRLQREGDIAFEAEEGMTVIALNTAPELGSSWNPVARAFDSPPAPPPAIPPQISKVEFLRDGMGLPALAAALALEGADPNIAAFRMLIDNATTIDLSAPTVIGGLRYLASKGVLTDADVTRILTLKALS